MAPATLISLLSAGATSSATPAESEQEVLKRLSLAELMNVEVTTVSRKPESLSATAAAVAVIHSEQIQRSGVTSIADALRFAPGVQVAQIDANKWAVGVRGFASRLSRSVLAMTDGRTLYTPLFAGVYWETQEMLLDDVDRIEVVRGPGASLWGANAYGGVISILTKPARDTQGWLVTGGAGNQERGFGSFRYGGQLDDHLHYRFHGKFSDRGPGFHEAEEGFDTWRMGQSGFRMDWDEGTGSGLSLIGNVYDGRTGQRTTVTTYSEPFTETLKRAALVSGQNVLGRWDKDLRDRGTLTLQAWYDRTSRIEPHFQEARDTVDVELKHRFAPAARHDLTWGLGYRLSSDETSAVETIAFRPSDRTIQLFSGYFQDDVDLAADRLRLSLGARFEHNDFTGVEIQPSARLAWTTPRQTAWFALSRAVRTPSRVEQDLSLTVSRDPASGAFPRVLGDGQFFSESVVAWQGGHRFRLGEHVLVDSALFYNDYSNLLSLEPGPEFIEPGDGDALRRIRPYFIRNELEGESWGFEIASELDVSESFRLRAAYAFIDITLRNAPGSLDSTSAAAAENTPAHQATFTASANPFRETTLDLVVRGNSGLGRGRVSGYAPFDLRFGWRAAEWLALSLSGRNLAQAHHVEFVGSRTPVGVPRSAYARIDFRF